MAKKSKKSARGRKAAPKKAASKRAVSKKTAGVNTDVRNALAQLENEKERVAREIEQRRIKLLKEAIEKKNEVLAKANQSLSSAQEKVDQIQAELDDLKSQAGEAPAKGRRGRKPGRPAGKKTAKGRKSSGRKPRVSTETKRAVVADTLKEVKLPVPYAQFRDRLLTKTDPASKGKVFSTPDFNSSQKFGQKYLPKGYKIQGDRRDAKVVKT